MIVRCDECHMILAVETLGEWVEYHDDGSHTHHFDPPTDLSEACGDGEHECCGFVTCSCSCHRPTEQDDPEHHAERYSPDALHTNGSLDA